MRKLKINGIYKHFKGDSYLVIDTAIDSDDFKTVYVIYRKLYGDNGLLIRKYDEFMSEVDHKKYPNVKKKYRFTYKKIKSIRENCCKK